MLLLAFSIEISCRWKLQRAVICAGAPAQRFGRSRAGRQIKSRRPSDLGKKRFAQLPSSSRRNVVSSPERRRDHAIPREKTAELEAPPRRSLVAGGRPRRPSAFAQEQRSPWMQLRRPRSSEIRARHGCSSSGRARHGCSSAGRGRHGWIPPAHTMDAAPPR